jgi:hypothetical protein
MPPKKKAVPAPKPKKALKALPAQANAKAVANRAALNARRTSGAKGKSGR